MKKVIVILSGGMDSTTLLHYHAKGGDQVRAVGFNYNQRHNVELFYAKSQCYKLSIPFERVELVKLGSLLKGSSQTDMSVPVPEGHYSEESMKATVVPNRNMIMLSIALGIAVANKFDGVSYGAHAGDHAIYPDCREEFVNALNQAAALCDWHKVEIFRPFIKHTKADIVRLGTELNVDYKNTWTCYQGKAIHCGRCGTCVERILAFDEAGVADPVEYADREFAFKAQQEFDNKKK